MADGRMLKKKISLSRRLAALKSDSARLLYTWLLPHLDIEGRFSADPEVVKGQVVPRLQHLTPIKIDELLRDIASQELIIRYKNDGDSFMQFRRFGDEQNLRRDREKDSDIPEPENCIIINDLTGLPGELPDNSRQTPAQVKLSKVKLSKVKCSNLFNEFWEEWPKKRSKEDAIKAFNKINPDELLLDKMIEAIKKSKQSREWLEQSGQFIPYPATWLNGKRWEDEVFIGPTDSSVQYQARPWEEVRAEKTGEKPRSRERNIPEEYREEES